MNLPPEEFFSGEVYTSFEIDSFDDVVISRDAFDSAPEVKPFVLVFSTECFDAGLKVGSLLYRKGLPDSVGKL